MRIKKVLLIGLFVYWIIGLFTTRVFASEFSVGVYPPLLQIESQTNTTVTAPFTIQNQSKTDTNDLELTVVPFVPSQKFDGQVTLFPPFTQYAQRYTKLFSNTTILDGTQTISHIILAPLEQKQLTLSLNIPKEQDTGDYYFTILASSYPTSSDQSTVSSIQGEIGINVLLTLGNKEKPNGIIQDFSTQPFVFQGPVSINLLLENTTGNVFAPKGVVIIKNMFGQIVGSQSLLPVNVLSHASRFIPSENSGIKTQIIWPEKNIFGIYRAELTIALSPQGPLFTRTIYFIGAPIQFVIAFAIVVFLITFILLRIVEELQSQNDLN